MKTDYKGIIIPDYMIVIKWLENEGKCASDLHRELNITYKHLHEIKHMFIKLGWITIIKDERRHNMCLTEQGQKLLAVIDELLNQMKITTKDIIELIKKSQLKKETVNIEQLKKEVEQYDRNNML